ncbi:MAG: GH3 auxin-responsive promoter family protein [Clostridia bacterium]|nr:GH3 auxin-responsive promoter family protein [Clostridia bacterium]
MKQIHPSPLSRAVKSVLNVAISVIQMFRGRIAIHQLDQNSQRAVSLQRETLMMLLRENADTEYGRKYGFSGISTVEEYLEKVPLSVYDTYEPYIRRMIHEEQSNLLTREDPVHYAKTSGSVGVPKYIPLSRRELEIYGRYAGHMTFGVMDEYYRNTRWRSSRPGFVLNLLELHMTMLPNGVPCSAVSGSLLMPYRKFVRYFATSPWEVINTPEQTDSKYLRALFALRERNVILIIGAFMTAAVDTMDYICANWQKLVEDIAGGTISEEAKIPPDLRRACEKQMFADPHRARELECEFSKGFDEIIPRIWKKIQLVCCIGTGGFSAYTKRMWRYTGRNVPFSNLNYAASEGLIASARRTGDTSYVLVPDSGFYEFFPVKDENAGPKTIEDLEVGEEYELVMTNLSGLYRYRIQDVVRVTGFYNEAPMLQFIYRMNQIISIAGEKTNEEALDWSIAQFIKETGLIVHDYSIYAELESKPGHYVILMEPDHIVPREDIPRYRDVIEARLMQANPSFGEKIRTGRLGPSELVFVQQQSYQLYREMMMYRGVSVNQIKPVRVIDTPFKEKFFFGLRENYD